MTAKSTLFLKIWIYKPGDPNVTKPDQKQHTAPLLTQVQVTTYII